MITYGAERIAKEAGRIAINNKLEFIPTFYKRSINQVWSMIFDEFFSPTQNCTPQWEQNSLSNKPTTTTPKTMDSIQAVCAMNIPLKDN